MSLSTQPLFLDEEDDSTSSTPADGQEIPMASSPTITATTTVISRSDNTARPSSGTAGDSTHSHGGVSRTTVIVLSTVLSVVGLLVIAAVMWAFLRRRRQRSKLFNRGITPIGDDEIETWKGNRSEKGLEHGMQLGVAPTPAPARPESRGHQKHESVGSTKKPASVIVYTRRSEEQSQRSPTISNYFPKMSFDGGKTSFDKELPLTPIQARAPNAREGLTDEAIPGDEPFVSSPRRRASRLSKGGPRMPRQAHMRNKSSRSSSSLHNLGEGFAGYDSDGYPASHEILPIHSRVSSDVAPRVSLSDAWPAGDGLSPRPWTQGDDVDPLSIGRAIG